MSEIIGHNYIGGARSAAGDIVCTVTTPVPVKPCPIRSCKPPCEEVDAAAQAAAAAYPIFRNLPASRRAEFLEAIAAQLDALDDDFVALVTRETALPTARIQGERGRTSGQMRLFAQVLRRGDFYGARIDRALARASAVAAGRFAPVPDRRRTGRGVRREQFSAGILHRRW